MIYIAHRGLFDGPDKEKENHPEQIRLAISKGYDAEVDVWYKDEKWFLGHDGPTYEIDDEFLYTKGLWIHAKNIDAFYELSFRNLNFFWHQEDDYTLTSKGFIWTYPGKSLSKLSICVMPEWKYDISNFDLKCYGVCSDFVDLMSKNPTI